VSSNEYIKHIAQQDGSTPMKEINAWLSLKNKETTNERACGFAPAHDGK